MEASVSHRDFQLFRSPEASLGGLDAGVAARLLATAADIALIVDGAGVIQDIAFNEELSQEGYGSWIGRPWIETVTIESRAKVTELLEDAASKAPRWRQVNHPSTRGPDVPVRYSAVQLDGERIVAVGRDLRAVAALQQRLVDAQQSMEREYAKLRHAETRYRLLFQMASEAVLIVDAASQKVVDANPAAAQLLDGAARRVVGPALPELFDPADGPQLQDLLVRARMTGKTGEFKARLNHGGRPMRVSGSLFRQGNAAHLLVRLSPVSDQDAPGPNGDPQPDLLKLLEQAPDAFVVTDPDGLILTANPAFLDLAQLATEEQARGQSLGRWLGRPGIDLGVVSSNLRQHGSVRLFGTVLNGEYGGLSEVELSAVHVQDPERPCFGFVIRAVTRRPEGRSGRELPRSMEHLADLVGRVPLKDLVRETTDVIEQLCIEAALELTGDNRASAAEILGLSRQSLYVKLRRYGLGDLDDAADQAL